MADGEVKVVDDIRAIRPAVEANSSDSRITSHNQDFVLRTSLIALSIQLLPYAAFLVLLHIIFDIILSQSQSMRTVYWNMVEPLSLILRLALFVELIRRYFDRAYHFSGERVTDSKGKLGLSLQIAHIRYADIREVRLEQGVLGRLLNFGSLKLSTAGSNEYEVKIKNIDNVKEIMREVNLRRKALQK